MFASFLLFVLAASLTAKSGIEGVYPSGATIPVNCLRLTIRFSKAQPNSVLPRLQLRDSRGAAVISPFLEEELWSPDRKSLTVLFHPGRLKDGVGPHERLGPPLAGIKQATLTIGNLPLKTWIVTGPCGPVDPHAWKIDASGAGSHSAVKILLGKPVDVQAEHLIAVVDNSGQRVPGEQTLTGGESLWSFRPTQAWHAGEYRIVIHPELEDACGNRIDEAFEHVPSSGNAPSGEADLVFVIGKGRDGTH